MCLLLFSTDGSCEYSNLKFSAIRVLTNTDNITLIRKFQKRVGLIFIKYRADIKMDPVTVWSAQGQKNIYRFKLTIPTIFYLFFYIGVKLGFLKRRTWILDI
jgi:hypothetical protein